MMRAPLVLAIALLASPALAQTPTATPAATATPDATATPAVTATPVATATPAATPEAEPSPTPLMPDSHFGAFTEQPMDHGDAMPGMTPGVLGLPVTREGTGTAWQPDTVPMHGWHAALGPWSFMFHGTVFGGYIRQNDPDNPFDRGGEALVSMNHVMAMARRELGGGDLVLRTMFSAEPFTVPEEGYPLTAQSGEAFEGEPIHDRQHPHDLFMELAAMFQVPLGDDLGLQIYAAPAGEPALGPVGFPHRVSALANPLSPLSHHWQDSTHVAFGVATASLFTRHVKVEGSAFNGREPDDQRLDIEFPGIDSWSGRVSLMPMPELVLQASYGFLRSPEELHAEHSVHRWTASMLYSRPLRSEGNAAMSVIWGQNDSEEGTSSAFAVEAEVSGDGRNILFFRGESTRKFGHDLGLESDLGRKIYDVTSFAVGYLLELGPYAGLQPGVGVVGTTAFLDPELAPLYETDSPRGFMVFLRLRPAASHGKAHPHAPHHH